MIILNSEIDKFRDPDDYDNRCERGRRQLVSAINVQINFRSSNQHNSLQPFQPVMYPSAIAPLLRASSNPDLATDPVALDARSITERMIRTRQFWAHGIQVAAASLVNIPSEPKPLQQEPSKESEGPSS